MNTETGVHAPALKELQERECTKEELQAALVKLIIEHNKLCELVSQKQDRPWRATI